MVREEEGHGNNHREAWEGPRGDDYAPDHDVPSPWLRLEVLLCHFRCCNLDHWASHGVVPHQAEEARVLRDASRRGASRDNGHRGAHQDRGGVLSLAGGVRVHDKAGVQDKRAVDTRDRRLLRRRYLSCGRCSLNPVPDGQGR